MCPFQRCESSMISQTLVQLSPLSATPLSPSQHQASSCSGRGRWWLFQKRSETTPLLSVLSGDFLPSLHTAYLDCEKFEGRAVSSICSCSISWGTCSLLFLLQGLTHSSLTKNKSTWLRAQQKQFIMAEGWSPLCGSMRLLAPAMTLFLPVRKERKREEEACIQFTFSFSSFLFSPRLQPMG